MSSFAFLNQVGPLELLIILVVALLLFGGRLPDVGRNLGKSLAQFKRGLQDMREEIEREEPPPPPSSRPRPDGTREKPELPQGPTGSDPPAPAGNG
ncbi:MAG TPA: twin-arginine translocase TatA/TatE family subunit [Planctomycetota bacterium]|jgi:sec-independent protein translocase protein TatA|nr:twin-arginine translocase TatA/TatE family subunit [Planctomycetota bacterium]